LNSNILRQYRHDIYDCFLRAKDALFNTVDALMTETAAKSFPEVSQSWWFERKWPSLYEAFEDGHIDEESLRAVFARYLPKPDASKWLWIGIDATSIARPDAVTSADRTAQHVHNLPECKKPITFGWQFSTVVVLPQVPSSWTYILDQQRVTSETTKDRPVEVSWWKSMHVKQARWLEVTVLRVVRPHATNKERDPRISWFMWMGDPDADLAQIALGYVLRFGQEHGYRFDKQALLWEKPRLRTPSQFERWTLIVAIAHNHLALARDLVEPELRPWESKHRAPTPQQVRRGIGKLLPRLGTPARPPKSRGKAKGRIKGVKIGKATRFSVIRKKPKLPQLVPA